MASEPFERLDYVYMPSRDVAADAAWFTDVLGGRLIFAVEGMGTRSAAIALAADGPRIVLTDHLEDDRPILIFRVPDLRAATDELRTRGWERGRSLEIPQGPVQSFVAPGGQRIALYEVTRPGVIESFEGRRDF